MARNLRVLLLNNYLPPRGGAEVHVTAVRDLLRAAGHEAELHAPGDVSGWRDLRDRVHNPAVRRLVEERIREFRPDVIHVHNFLRRLSTAPFLAASEAGVPSLLSVHDYHLFCPRTWAIRSDGSPCERPSLPLCALGNCRGGLEGIGGRAAYFANAFRGIGARGDVRRHATRIVCGSRTLAARLEGVLGREVGVLPFPSPPAAPESSPPPNADLLFLNRVSPEKGPIELLESLARVRAAVPALRLTVAGDGPLLDAAKEMARALGLGEAVRFEGWVDPSRIPELLRAHGALVVPSVWMENFPLVVLDSLAAGRPVLGSTRGGIPEAVADGEAGLLFDPLDPAALDGALRRWAALPDGERAAMGRKARERAAAWGGPPEFLGRLLDEYHRTIQSAAKAPRS